MEGKKNNFSRKKNAPQVRFPGLTIFFRNETRLAQPVATWTSRLTTLVPRSKGNGNHSLLADLLGKWVLSISHFGKNLINHFIVKCLIKLVVLKKSLVGFWLAQRDRKYQDPFLGGFSRNGRRQDSKLLKLMSFATPLFPGHSNFLS